MPGHKKKSNLVMTIVYTITYTFFQNFRTCQNIRKITQAISSVNITDQQAVDVPPRRHS